jgi:hypothetical protein
MALSTLTKSLPRLMSAAGGEDIAKNVTPPDDLSPISAALAAYHRIIAHDNGNGVQ